MTSTTNSCCICCRRPARRMTHLFCEGCPDVYAGRIQDAGRRTDQLRGPPAGRAGQAHTLRTPRGGWLNGVEHPAVAEAGVIGKPDPVRGEIIKAFIALRDGYAPSEELKADIIRFVREGLAAHAAPREIEFRDKLPKTRSGKIMRRVLKAWELNMPTGDLSTMED